MNQVLFKKIRLAVLATVSVGIWALLIWEHYHGGVPIHFEIPPQYFAFLNNGAGILCEPHFFMACFVGYFYKQFVTAGVFQFLPTIKLLINYICTVTHFNLIKTTRCSTISPTLNDTWIAQKKK